MTDPILALYGITTTPPACLAGPRAGDPVDPLHYRNGLPEWVLPVEGYAAVTRHEDGTVTVDRADDVIKVAAELAHALHLGPLDPLVLDTAGEYRYRPVGKQERGAVLVYRREQS